MAMVKYRVLGKVFVNGSLIEPSGDPAKDIIEAEDGLHGPHLQQVGKEPYKGPAGRERDVGVNPAHKRKDPPATPPLARES